VTAAPVWALYEAGDEGALRAAVHPDIEVSDPERTGPGPIRGRDDFVAFVREWREAWDAYELSLEAPVVIGDQVVALVRYRGTVRGSGTPLELRAAHVLGIRDGLIAHMRLYSDRGAALAAAGVIDPERWLAALDTLLAGYEAWNRRDFEALTEYLGDAEFVPVTQSPDMTAFTGREAAQRFWDSSVATWESFHFTPLAFEPEGDQLLVDLKVNAQARTSGIRLEEEWAHLYTLRDGEFVRLQAFTSGGEARAALSYPERP
jgi:ketosteroid isomerase-like protein